MKEGVSLTITGIDDYTNFRFLLEITNARKDIEFGVLHYPKKMGSNRYPSMDTINFLAQCGDLDKSLHICGENNIYTFISSGGKSVPAGYKRIQLNCSEVELTPIMLLDIKRIGLEMNIIIQVKSWISPAILCDCNPLFDASGGKGEAQTRNWALAKDNLFLSSNRKMGFAGGIKETTLKKDLNTIWDMGFRNFWIDIESGVRYNDQFYLPYLVGIIREFDEWKAS